MHANYGMFGDPNVIPCMRIATWNVNSIKQRLDGAVAWLSERAPDLVCLQEVDRNVDRSLFHDQPALLSEALGLSVVLFQHNHPVRTGGYGNLILSRWPFQAHHHISIRHEERIIARVNGGGITRTEQRALNQQENAVSRQIAR